MPEEDRPQLHGNLCPECGSDQIDDHYYYLECRDCGITIEREKEEDDDLDEDAAERRRALIHEEH